jgi:hypothetical protein
MPGSLDRGDAMIRNRGLAEATASVAFAIVILQLQPQFGWLAIGTCLAAGQNPASGGSAASGRGATKARPAERPPGLVDAARTVNEAITKLQFESIGDRQIPRPEGREIVPVTVNEIVTAIRNWDRKNLQVDDNVFQVYQKIAETKELPPDAELSAHTQWWDADRTDKREYRVLWIDLTVKTGQFAGYTFRIRDQRVGQRVALRPQAGFNWVVEPQPPLRPGRALVNRGLVYLMEEDHDGALIVIVNRRTNTAIKEVRVVAFDDQGNGHVALGNRLADFEVNTDVESVIERYRLDPQKLPRGNVKFVGFEGSQTEPVGEKHGATDQKKD